MGPPSPSPSQTRLVELAHAIHMDLEVVLSKMTTASAKEAAFHELITEAALTYSDYKGIARDNFVATDLARCELQERKKEMDEKHLQLQNLLYHKDHLQRSIRNLQEHPLNALQKVEREVGAEGQQLLVGELASVKPADEHKLNQSRLQEEREERRRLHEELQTFQAKKVDLSGVIEGLKDTLFREIPGQIQELHDCARSIRARSLASGDTSGGSEETQRESLARAEWAGLSAEELTRLPVPLHTLLSRVSAYIDAIDPEGKTMGCTIVAAGDTRDVVVAEEKVAAMDVVLDDEEQPPGIRAVDEAGNCVVSPQAVCLKIADEEHPGASPYLAYFYYCPAIQAVLVHTPEDPGALINLMPMDMGDSASGAANRSVVSYGEHWKGPRPFRWVQWLSGSQPFPPRLVAALSPEYSSACLLDRIYIRLRCRRILEQQLSQMRGDPLVLPLDPSAGPSILADLSAVDNSNHKQQEWELVKCVELQRADLPKDVHFSSYGGEQSGAAVDQEPSEQPTEDQQPRSEGADVGEGAWEGWAHYGARYLELTLTSERQQSSSRKAGTSVKAFFEIPAEYPVRPPRVRVLSSTHSKTSTSSIDSYKQVETEVNAHFDESIGDHAKARDWLFPHQVRRLLMCMNKGAPGDGGRRWGKDRCRPFSQDVQARLLLPR